jgi:hypothetical protein
MARKKLEEISNCFLQIDRPLSQLGDGEPTAPIGNKLLFTSMPPELGSSKQANISPIHILGRANPLWVYSNSSERSWNLELKFFVTVNSIRVAGVVPGSVAKSINDFDVREQVLDKVNWCESLVYPIYIDGLSRGVPEVLFFFGDTLRVKCICTDVNTSFPGPWYIKAPGEVGYPMHAAVNLTLKQLGNKYTNHIDVRNNRHNGKSV